MPRIEYFEPTTGRQEIYYLNIKDFISFIECDFKDWDEKVTILNQYSLDNHHHFYLGKILA
jgi:hypothetical protein